MTTFACPICESRRPDDYTVVGYGSQPEGVRHYPVLRCRRHGVEFADAVPVPVSDAVRREHLDVMYEAGEHARYEDFLDRVEAVVGSRRGVLHDVGCGHGALLAEAQRRGWQVQGNDLVDARRRDVAAGIRCFVGPLSALDLDPASCDVVTSFCVLPHHLTEPTPDMLAVHRLLKPGGWFVLQFPANGLYRRLGKVAYHVCWPWRPTQFARFVLANLYGPGGHQFAYTSTNLTEYLRKCGFTGIRVTPYYPAVRFTVARFRNRPAWVRAAALAAAALLHTAGRLLRMPNHAIAFARTPE